MLLRRFSVHSVFLTVQGEGTHIGKRAVFCRFSGCNVWNGKEATRDRDSKNSACALICDTQFAGHDPKQHGGVYTQDGLVQLLQMVWGSLEPLFVVFTGGEPGLQLTSELVAALQYSQPGAYVAVESNGSKLLPENLDWVCVSPKPPMPLVQKRIDELKLLYPLFNPADFADVWVEGDRWLQPVDAGSNPLGAQRLRTFENIQKTLDYVREHPEWRISVQAHKLWNVP